MEPFEKFCTVVAGFVAFCLLAAALGYLSDASGLTQGRNSPFFTPSPSPTPKMPQRPERK